MPTMAMLMVSSLELVIEIEEKKLQSAASLDAIKDIDVKKPKKMSRSRKNRNPFIRRGLCCVKGTRHRAIVPDGYPSSILAAAAFHDRVRDGVGVGPLR